MLRYLSTESGEKPDFASGKQSGTAELTSASESGEGFLCENKQQSYICKGVKHD